MASLELDDILKKYAECESYYSEGYKRGKEDLKFTLGDQWPDEVKKERVGRPCLVENRTLPFVNQVLNNIRQSRLGIVVRPVDDTGDVKSSEIMRGIIRNIEVVSNAPVVYDTAARNSVMAGIGWIRIKTDYADYKSFDQEIRLERVEGFDGTYLDPAHKNVDGSDANFGFTFTNIPKKEFERQFPDAAAEGITADGWASSETVRVADYFYKDHEEKTLCEYEVQTIAGVISGTAFKDELPPSATVKRERKTRVCKVKYAKITGADILEEGEFAGEYIPIVPVYGFEVFVDGKREVYSLIHQARDPQMMLNFWKSASAEVYAMQPKAPYIGAVGQFETYKQVWESANNQNFPYLEYDMVVDPVTNTPAPPPMRQPPPTPSAGMVQEVMMNVEAIKGALGVFDASLGNQTNDISGKAVIRRQVQGDNATFHFIDNLAIAIQHVGRILVNMIPIIYSDKRILRIIGDDGQEELVPVNQPVVKTKTGYQRAEGRADAFFKFDGKYDVVVEVEKGYATRRQELADTILELSRSNPAIMAVAGDLLVKSLDFPKADELAKRIRATMAPELLGEDVEAARLQKLTEALNMMQEKLAQTEQALLGKQQNEEFKNKLEAEKVQNDTRELMIKAALADAEIAKMQAETAGGNADAMQTVAMMIQELKAGYDDVSGALDVLLSEREGVVTGSQDEVPETGETPENGEQAEKE